MLLVDHRPDHRRADRDAAGRLAGPHRRAGRAGRYRPGRRWPATPPRSPTRRPGCGGAAMLGVLATVMLQALAMHTAVSVFLDPDANLAALGIPQDTDRRGQPVHRRLPAVGHGEDPRHDAPLRHPRRSEQHAGLFLRMLLIQQVSRFVRLPSFGRGRAAAAGAGGRGPRRPERPVDRRRPPPSSRTGGPECPGPRRRAAAAARVRPRAIRPRRSGAAPAAAGRPATSAASTRPVGGRIEQPAAAHGAGRNHTRARRCRRVGPAGRPYGRPPVRHRMARPATGRRSRPANRPAPAGGRPSGTGWPGTRACGPPATPATPSPAQLTLWRNHCGR